MKPTYTIPNDPITGEPSANMIVKIDEDGREWFIPRDEDNRMYREYLKRDEAETI